MEILKRYKMQKKVSLNQPISNEEGTTVDEIELLPKSEEEE